MENTALIIDDAHACRSVLKKQLEKHSYAVSTKETGIEALKFLSNNSVNIIFLDESLSDESGLDILDKIKAQTPKQIVVMYTSLSDASYIEKAKQKGALGILSKNLKDQSLINILNQVKRKSANTSNNEPVSNLATPKQVVSFADIDESKLNKEKVKKKPDEGDVTAVFNRARYDYMKHHLEAIQERQKKDARRINRWLWALALPLFFLLTKPLIDTSTSTQITENIKKSKEIASLEFALEKQKKAFELLSIQLEEHQQYVDRVKDSVSSLNRDQKTLGGKISSIATVVDDVKINVKNTKEASLKVEQLINSINTNNDGSESKIQQITRGDIDRLEEN